MPEVMLSDGATLAYATWGAPEAPAVVLLHGLTLDHRMWGAQAIELAGDYFVVAPDLRGGGRSSAPVDLASYTMDRFAADVSELLDELEIRLCALAGCSFGGMVAMQLAVDRPERIACLVLSDTSPAPDHPGYDERFRQRERGLAATMDYVARHGTVALGQRLGRELHDPFLGEAIARRWAGLPPEGIAGRGQARNSRPSLVPALRERLTMPVMLAAGEEDPVAIALEVMSAELPGARVVVFAGAGHGVPAIRPDAFTGELLRFLADVEEGRPVAGRRRV